MAKRWFGYIQLDTIIKQKYNLAFSMELRISIGLYTLHIIPSFEKHTQDIASSLQTLSTSFAKRSLPLRTIPRVVLLPGVNSSDTITSFSLLFRDRLSICILVLVLALMLVPAGTSSPRRSKSSFTSLLCSLLLLLLPGVCPCECEPCVE